MSGRLSRRPWREGFTLIEMLVVIGIIAVLIGASIGGFAKMTRSADKAKAQELVSNVATALTALFQEEGVWPKRLLAEQAGGDGRLNANAAYGLVSGRTKYFSLSTVAGRLAGQDRFGILTPWAAAVVKREGTAASLSSKVGALTVENHILHYAIDPTGRGVVEAKVGGETVKIRATAAVWCIGKSGGDKGQPWPYTKGLRKDDIYSWAYGQTQDVK